MSVQVEKIYLRDADGIWAALPDWTYTNNGTTTTVSNLFDNNAKVTQAVTTANGDYPVVLKATTATTTTIDTTVFGSKIKANPSTGNLTVSSVNNLTLSAATTGFIISGGTTSKTLTVPTSVTIAAAAGYNVSNTLPVSSTSAKLPTCSAVASAISSAVSAAHVPPVSTTAGTAITTAAASAGTTDAGTAYSAYNHTHQITSDTITGALGYTPVSTHYISKNIVGRLNTATANTSAANGSVYLNHLEESTVQSSHKITGTGATTVTADDNGDIIINSISYATITPEEATAGTATASKVITAKVLHGERASWYGTSASSPTAAAKAVTTAAPNGDIAGYKLKKGTQIVVNFTTANTVTNAGLTLNVGGTGYLPIYVDGAVTSSTNQFLWDADTEIEFIYDGTNYRVVSAPISDEDITNLLNS